MNNVNFQIVEEIFFINSYYYFIRLIAFLLRIVDTYVTL